MRLRNCQSQNLDTMLTVLAFPPLGFFCSDIVVDFIFNNNNKTSSGLDYIKFRFKSEYRYGSFLCITQIQIVSLHYTHILSSMIYGITYWARQQHLLSISELWLDVFKTGFKQIKSKKYSLNLGPGLFSVVENPNLTAASQVPTQRRVLTIGHPEPKQLLFLMSAPLLSFRWVSGAGVKSQRKEFDALRAAGQRVWDDGSVTAVSFAGLDSDVTQAKVDCTDDCSV